MSSDDQILIENFVTDSENDINKIQSIWIHLMNIDSNILLIFNQIQALDLRPVIAWGRSWTDFRRSNMETMFLGVTSGKDFMEGTASVSVTC